MGNRWFRVTDPLSPLNGCDVRLRDSDTLGDITDCSKRDVALIIALRKVDVFVGDRPFQLIAKDGEDLGLWIKLRQLADSPFQDDIMEIGNDRPFGLCLNESEMTRPDGCTLRVARYEHAIQIAFDDSKGNLLATHTETSDTRDVLEETVVNMFETDEDPDNITYVLRAN